MIFLFGAPWFLQDAHAQSFSPPSSHLCDRVTTGTAAQQIVAAAASANIYVCGYDVDAIGANASFSLAYGTGTNCNVGTTNISPVISGSNQGNAFVDHTIFAFLTLPTGQNLCVTSDSNTDYAIYWGQY
jgi:hypothetical protein